MAAAALPTSRRRSLAGEPGWKGLVRNRRIFAITVFTSLGGLIWGYNQGVFGGVLGMRNFQTKMASAVDNSVTKGWLVSILELGAWFGYFADKISRKYTIELAVIVFCIGVIVQTTAKGPQSIYGGRFVTGLGVGSISMAVPLYNAELAPPEVRGSLVALSQLALAFGIMISFWIDYGTNFIGGSGATQSEASWRIPIALQLIPALILGAGILFMPFSPRWLVNQGRDDEALAVLSSARGLPSESELVQIEFLEIKTQYLFEKETSAVKFPDYQDGSFSSNFKLGVYEYLSLFTNPTLFRRIMIGTLTMLFQQWTGVNAVLYYAPSIGTHSQAQIFKNLGLSGNATDLLATGVVGICMFLGMVPAVIYVDQVGRKPVLVFGAFLMGACHLTVAILIGLFHNSFPSHVAAGWAACSLLWVFAMAFGFSWGVRGKGLSIAASSNWMNNFIVGEAFGKGYLIREGFGTFVFFGVFSLMGGLFIMFFVPETKGVTLEEMEEVFGATGHNLAVEDQQRLDAYTEKK
ncbi:general substrate transporter [Gymnopus androsaceus JB14]|uniref:General substrate transporter n=1 Tax=Gymnopus androsaceus JB14 TaxID=1447944 RepID=A0A6A4GCH6_9AGAR|nr:general substrate transporter [Gymnopus androsaceus JB14]